MRKKVTKTLAALTGTVVTALVARALLRDRTLALLTEGYTLIPRRCQRYRSTTITSSSSVQDLSLH